MTALKARDTTSRAYGRASGASHPILTAGGLLRLGAERRGEEAEEERADLAALRAASSGIPVILQPGRIGPEELAGYAAEFGAVAVLDKPFSVGELVEAVRGAIEGR